MFVAIWARHESATAKMPIAYEIINMKRKFVNFPLQLQVEVVLPHTQAPAFSTLPAIYIDMLSIFYHIYHIAY